MPAQIAAQPMTPTDQAPAARTLARAFADDPLLTWLAGSRAARFAELAPAFFAEGARACRQVGGAWTVTDHRAVALWIPPSIAAVTPISLVRMAVPAARLFGVRIRTAGAVLAELDRRHPSTPHWYLQTLGTDPEHQGNGFGSLAIAPVLARCDREGVPAYLESTKERNVPFYERHGFRVTERITVKGSPPLWLMWREPADSSDG